jgi:hypothetical protein
MLSYDARLRPLFSRCIFEITYGSKSVQPRGWRFYSNSDWIVVLDKTALLRLVKENASTREIALRLCCDPTTVLRWIHRFDLPMPFRHPGGRPKRVSPEQEVANTVRYVSAHRKRLKIRSIQYKGGKCQLCGYCACNSALEFHHLDKKTKNFGLSKRGWTRSWESIKRELDKCILVCANCHREVEAGVRTIPPGLTLGKGA